MVSQKWAIAEFLGRSTDKAFEETTLARVLSNLPALSSSGPWLAGGALRRTLLGQEPDSDFDFFFRNADQVLAFGDALKASGLRLVRTTEHHLHYRGMLGGSGLERDIQLIRFKFYQTAEEVIDSFDYTICQFAFDGENIVAGEFSLWDLGRKRLAIHRITYPVASMRRLLKYASQGFTACAGAMTELLRQTLQNPEAQSQLNIQYVD